MKKLTGNKQVIGRVDKIDLPNFNIENLECKIDTGADTSSIHCTNVRIVEKEGKEYLKFRVLDKKHPLFSKQTHTVNEFSEKRVKSSSGHTESRFVIKTKAVVFGAEYPITFTLSDREKMKYPVLLGKRFLKNKFIVDVSEKDLSYKAKTEKL
jgi:hypothetical protein